MPIPTPLTDEQIDILFAFVKSKYVDFYDVQVELVDHLASEVEQRMGETPEITFESALQQVYSGFGIFGFLDVVEKKALSVERRNRKLWWEKTKELFRLPLIVGSLILALFLYIVFDSLDLDIFVIGNALLAVVGYFMVYFRLKERFPLKEYKLTSFQYSRYVYLGSGLNFYNVYFLLIGQIHANGNIGSAWLLLLPLSCWLGWMIFWAGILASDAMIEEQRKLYPQAFA